VGGGSGHVGFRTVCSAKEGALASGGPGAAEKARKVAGTVDPSYSSEHPEECCPNCGARLERGDDDTCNRCGGSWKEAKARPANNVSGKSLVYYKTASLKTEISQAEAETDTKPTPGRIDAGNYKKGKVRLHGLEISIENPKGSTRSGTSADGKKWSVDMKHTYGYIRRTEGADGDHVDCFIGPDPDSESVFVVNQLDPKTRKFDEHKTLLGWKTQEAAEAGYLSSYERGWKGLGSVKAMTMPKFKEWLDGDTTKRATRNDRHGGVSDLAGNEDTLSLSGRCELSEVRSSRYSGVQKVAGLFLGFLCRHGAKTAGDDAGSDQNGEGLLAEELSVGYSNRAGAQSAYYSVFGLSRRKVASIRSGAASRVEVGDSVNAIEQVRLARAGGSGDTSGRTIKRANRPQSGVLSRQDAVTGTLGKGAGNSLSDVESPAGSRVECRASIDRAGTKEAAASVASLRKAKKESDRGNFPSKHHILREEMEKDPESFEADDTQGRYHGVTHVLSGFRLHTDPSQIPEKVRRKKAVVSDEDFFASPPNKEGRKCPGCGQLFKECEPLANVEMCEACERYGPSKDKEAADKRYRTHVEEYEVCEHCGEEIGEKSLYRDPKGRWYHRPCMSAGSIKRASHIPTVGVDFDGTIAKLVEPFEKDISALKPRSNARKWMKKFQDMGARVIIFTVRDDEQGIKDWCHEHDIPYDYVNENPDQPPDSSGKVMCDVYWDDRGVNAQGALDKSGPDVVKRLEKAGEAPPIWARTLNTQLASPTWTPGIGVIGNLGANFREARERGQRMARDQQSLENLRAQLEPGFGYKRLQAILSGKYKPVVANPIDQALFQQHL